MKKLLPLLIFAALLATPQIAQAGLIDIGPPPSSGAPCSTNGSCHNHYWSFQKFSAAPFDLIHVEPHHTTITWNQGEFGYVTLPIAENPWDGADYVAALVRPENYNFGQNWWGIACVASGTACAAGFQPTVGSTVAVHLNRGEGQLRVGYQHKSATRTFAADASLGADFRLRYYAVDNQVPTVHMYDTDDNEVAEGQTYNASTTDGGTKSFRVEAEDNTAIANTAFSVGPNLVGTSATLADGAYSLGVGACDIAQGPQNCITKFRNVRIDTGYPQLTYSGGPIIPVSNPTFRARAVDPTINGYSTGLQAVSAMEVYIDEVRVGGSVTAAADGSLTVSLQSPLPDGAHTMRLGVTDNAGNKTGPGGGAEGGEYPFMVDTQAPVFSDLSPAPGQLHVDKDGGLSASASDGEGSGLEAGSMKLDGVPVAAMSSDGSFSYNGRICPGSHKVNLSATDKAGFTGSKEYLFSVDGKPSQTCEDEFLDEQQPEELSIPEEDTPVVGEKQSKGYPVKMKGKILSRKIKKIYVSVKSPGSKKYKVVKTIKIKTVKSKKTGKKTYTYKGTFYVKKSGTYRVRIGYRPSKNKKVRYSKSKPLLVVASTKI